MPGQYTVKIVPDSTGMIIDISEVKMYYDGQGVLDEFVSISGNEISINRTAQVTDESKITLQIKLDCEKPCQGDIMFRPALIY